MEKINKLRQKAIVVIMCVCSIFLIAGCNPFLSDDEKAAIGAVERRMKFEVKDPVLQNVKFVREKIENNGDFVSGMVCGEVNFKDNKSGDYLGFTHFSVRVNVFENNTRAEMSSFKFVELRRPECVPEYEKEWADRCNKPSIDK